MSTRLGSATKSLPRISPRLNNTMAIILSIIGLGLGVKYVASPGLETAQQIYDDFMAQYEVAKEAGQIDVVGIATDPSTYTDAFLEGLGIIFR